MAIGAAFADVNLAGRGTQLLVAGQYGESKSYVVAGVRQPQLPGAPVALSLSGVWRLEDFSFFENHRKVLSVPTRLLGVEAQGGWVATPNLRLMVGVLYNRHTAFAPKFVDPTAPAPAYNARSGNVVVGQFLLQYDDTSAPQGLRRGPLARCATRSPTALGHDFDYLKVDLKLERSGSGGGPTRRWRCTSSPTHPTSRAGAAHHAAARGRLGPGGFNTWEFRGTPSSRCSSRSRCPSCTTSGPPHLGEVHLAAAVFADGGVILARATPALHRRADPGAEQVGLHAARGGRARGLPGIAIPRSRPTSPTAST
jgi:hypothetical protein